MNTDHEDIWDDSLLIQAWNESWTKMKRDNNMDIKLPLIHNSNKSKKKSYNKGKWAIDDICFATWEEDSNEYLAKILSIDYEKKICEVIFPEYGNIDIVDIKKLRPYDMADKHIDRSSSLNNSLYSSNISLNVKIEENILESKETSETDTTSTSNNDVNCETDNFNDHGIPRFLNPLSSVPLPSLQNGPVFPPFIESPLSNTFNPTPNFDSQISNNLENEALAQMLISWYMTGYHTGYYKGMQQMNSTVKLGQPYAGSTNNSVKKDKKKNNKSRN